MTHGTVKWFDASKGYGFFSTAAGEVFFHISALTNLRPGSHAELTIEQGPNGPLAGSVTLLPAVHPPTGATHSESGSSTGTEASLGFRGVAWGSSPGAVLQANDGEPKVERENLLVYEGMIAEVPAEIVYLFVGNQLARGKYLIKRWNDDQYVLDFSRLETLLARKYGSPDVNDIWLDSYGSDRSTDIARAVSYGELARFRNWRLTETDVVLAMTATDFTIELCIEYSHRDLASLEQEHLEQGYLEDL